MALSVTNITRAHGVNCNHFIVTVNHEGTTRQFQVNGEDLNSLIEELGGPMEAQKKTCHSVARLSSRTCSHFNWN